MSLHPAPPLPDLRLRREYLGQDETAAHFILVLNTPRAERSCPLRLTTL